MNASSTNWGGIFVGIGLVVAAFTGLYFYARKPGWYVMLYSDPVGDPDRRLKGYRGPFPTRDEAVSVARTQLDAWVPKVEYADIPPNWGG